jgi:hypothetical protein
MSRPRITLGEVFDTLAEERLFGSGWALDLPAKADLRTPQPWYVRTMVGYGAWLGSLLILSAVVGLSLAATGGGYVLLGLVFIFVSIMIRRATKSEFLRHSAIATSLSGQGLLAGGIAYAGDFQGVDSVFLTLIVANVLLLGAFPDRNHRYLSVMLIVGSVVSLVYLHEAQAILPVFGPLLAFGVVVLMESEARMVSAGLDEALIPIMAGMLVSAFGCLLLSTLYIIPEVAEGFTFYPRPWISTLLFGALLFYVQRDIWAGMFGDPGGKAATVAYGLTAVVLIAALPAPGLILALLVMAVGLVHGSLFYAGSGVVFLTVFLGAFFYGIDISMLTKSATLVGTGVAILLARRVLTSFTGPSTGDAGA